MPALAIPRRARAHGAHAAPGAVPAADALHDITFCVGPAGTGKTFLAVAAAVDALERDTVKRIVLTRPAVEAGEKLGFLPGDLAQKVDPYLRPLYDALYDLMGYDMVNRAFERGAIEIAPLAFMRGRTLNHSFIILDEAQNTTPEQMKMFLTRIGFGSKAVSPATSRRSTSPRARHRGLSTRAMSSRACAASPSRSSSPRTSCATRWCRRSSTRTSAATERSGEARRAARLARCPHSRRTRVAKVGERRGRACDGDPALRGRGRKPPPQPRIPRQGLRDQRAVVRLFGQACSRATS